MTFCLHFYFWAVQPTRRCRLFFRAIMAAGAMVSVASSEHPKSWRKNDSPTDATKLQLRKSRPFADARVQSKFIQRVRKFWFLARKIRVEKLHFFPNIFQVQNYHALHQFFRMESVLSNALYILPWEWEHCQASNVCFRDRMKLVLDEPLCAKEWKEIESCPATDLNKFYRRFSMS